MTRSMRFRGKCALCKIEKDLTAVRDGLFICPDCDDDVQISLIEDDPAICSMWNREQSWLWGEFITPGMACETTNLCRICKERRSTSMVIKGGEKLH